VDREGLTAPLRRYLDLAASQAGIDCTLDEHLSRQPSSDAGVLIYRIAQASLIEIVKHSGAQTVGVVVEDSEGGFGVRITHDGIGCDPDALPAARGLTAIRERAELAGGRLAVLRAGGSETTIDYWIPELEDVVRAEPNTRAVLPEGSEPAW
jgi:signal transduction histidine kinase